MRYFLEISFKGAAYCGWQRQPNGISVQETVEKALETLFRMPVSILGAGRTDAGVNAYSLPAHADLPNADPYTREKWRRSLNGILPNDISVRSICPVLPNAHARFDAVQRTYLYFVVREQDPFMGPFVLPLHDKIDFDVMNEAAQYLLGEHDFTSFTRLHTDSKTNLCRITEAFWSPASYPGCHLFTISANRFLRNMVRAVVGTLLEVGRGKYSPEEFRAIIAAENRNVAGASVKGEALFLKQVHYPPGIFIEE